MTIDKIIDKSDSPAKIYNKPHYSINTVKLRYSIIVMYRIYLKSKCLSYSKSKIYLVSRVRLFIEKF